ncbi:class I SAM-dependent methyltransferase [Kitasatospora cineracea]|uniref:Methyltransferase family protein n=1 Tax=Kitasatospora cineracea TaxID=88074 RepID=A0A8G1XBQ2_9ACTN|nr:class I SAM-dependent methyltransferase [Kitasatospora cineracea]ROR35641.1 methyltransferase family protein [Kitasatospora cineracea]
MSLPAALRADTADAADAAVPWVDDPFGRAVRAGRGPLWLRRADGSRLPLEVERWCAPAAGADLGLLARCRGLSAPVLDLGCGPGRLVAELLATGVPALGVDVCAASVDRTTGLGGLALHRSVFDRLPAEGRWGAVLLADGNLGIGGDPAALLARSAGLLAPGGLLLVETAPEEVDEVADVRVEGPDGAGPPFPWARCGPAAALRHARTAGLAHREQWHSHGRSFLALTRP